jgi:hypothetical protein
MASPQIQSAKRYWDSMAKVKEPPTIETMRLNDHYWAGLTGEPGDVDYIEASVDGIPALWAVPKGAVWDRVIICLHGGGYMMGSRYSHRKIFAHIARAIGCRALIIDYRLTPEHPSGTVGRCHRRLSMGTRRGREARPYHSGRRFGGRRIGAWNSAARSRHWASFACRRSDDVGLDRPRIERRIL